MLPEPSSPEQPERKNDEIITESQGNAEKETDDKGNMCTNIIKDCALVIFRKRTGNGRKIVYLIFVIVFVAQALEFGKAI